MPGIAAKIPRYGVSPLAARLYNREVGTTCLGMDEALHDSLAVAHPPFS